MSCLKNKSTKFKGANRGKKGRFQRFVKNVAEVYNHQFWGVISLWVNELQGRHLKRTNQSGSPKSAGIKVPNIFTTNWDSHLPENRAQKKRIAFQLSILKVYIIFCKNPDPSKMASF